MRGRSRDPFGRSPFRPSLPKEEFEKLVGDALASIPARFKKLIENVAVLVEDEPPPGRPLLGLYHGVPFKHRGPGSYGNLPPDVIVIYQGPIERISRTAADIQDHVLETVLHEVGHYFGLEESELRAVENEWRKTKKGETR